MLRQVRFSGFGGQGIIRSGHIGGKAAALFDGKYATMTQSFGPEARGSACSSQLVVSDSPVLYPYVTQADVLVAMSQEAYDKYVPGLRARGKLLIDQDLVKQPGSSKASTFPIPATRMAEELGNKIVANVVMLGFFAAVTDVLSAEAMKKALPGSVPKTALELNIKAFDRGYEYGREMLKKRRKERSSPARGEDAKSTQAKAQA